MIFCTIRNYAEVAPRLSKVLGGDNGYALKSYGTIVLPGNPFIYPDNLPRVNAHGGPEGRPGCWQKVTKDLYPFPYLVMDTGYSIAPYNHFEFASPLVTRIPLGPTDRREHDQPLAVARCTLIAAIAPASLIARCASIGASQAAGPFPQQREDPARHAGDEHGGKHRLTGAAGVGDVGQPERQRLHKPAAGGPNASAATVPNAARNAASSDHTVPTGMRNTSQGAGDAGRSRRAIADRTGGVAVDAATPTITGAAAASPSRRPDHSCGGRRPSGARADSASTPRQHRVDRGLYSARVAADRPARSSRPGLPPARARAKSLGGH